MRTLETAGLLGDIFFFHPHDHLINSHYCPHFMGEETEAQTREETCPRLRDELRFKFRSNTQLFTMSDICSSILQVYQSPSKTGEPKPGLCESGILCLGTGSTGSGVCADSFLGLEDGCC